jgi:hypothetical protein
MKINNLSDCVRQKSKESSFLDCVFDSALVAGTVVGAASRLDLVPAIKIA